MRKASGGITDIWEEVGLELGLLPHKLATIKLDNPGENAKASLDMLLKWRERNKNATQEELQRAIEVCRAKRGICFI